MALTATQIEEAKRKLTIEAFVARKLILASGKLAPLWLCTKAETQQELLAQVQAAYDAWVTEELRYLTERMENDPLARVGVLESKRSPTE